MQLTLGRLKQVRKGNICNCTKCNCKDKKVINNIVTDALNEVLPVSSDGQRKFITEVQIDKSSIFILAGSIAVAGLVIKMI